jgi:hypothetical protein
VLVSKYDIGSTSRDQSLLCLNYVVLYRFAIVLALCIVIERDESINNWERPKGRDSTDNHSLMTYVQRLRGTYLQVGSCFQSTVM